MDMQKEREAFQECYKTSRDYKFYVKHEMSEKQIFEFKNGKYVVDCVNDGWKIWQAAKAQAVPEGFVLIKDDTKTVVAIERMVEQQVEASGMDSRRLERLDGWKIIEAAVKAQEPAND